MSNQDLGEQLSLLTSINDMIGKVSKGFEALGSTISQQTDYMRELAGAGDDIDSDSVKDMTSALEDLASGSEDAGDAAKKMGKQFAVAGSVLVGAQKGMSTFKNVLGGTFNAVSGLASGIFNLAKGAVGALMQSWSGLLSMAQDIAAQGDSIAKAYEAVRGEFGNLASNEGKAVVEMNKALRNEFASTAGMSLGAIYGTNLTGALEAMSQMAQDLGASFNRLADDFVDNAAAALVMNEGLGMSAEALAGLRDQAVQAGEDMTTALEETTVQVMVMSKQYGVSGKVIGKNLSKLTENMAEFGHMSRAELTATATYAAKLGVEIDSLKGMFDKFANFEDAAVGAAKLAETFGMNVDAMALMNAESPAEQMDMMRQAFMETGRSLDDLSRQEKAYLAEQMGVDPNDLYAMMDPANADVSFDEMVADAEAAQEQMSPEEAMLEAAKGIEKSVEHMMDRVEGFFEAFTDGFMHALSYTEMFMKGSQKVRDALREVFEIGKELANELFGSTGVFGSNSSQHLDTLQGLLDGIVQFFRDIKDAIVELAKTGDFKQFTGRINDAIQNFFSSDKVQEFGGKILNGIATALNWVLSNATSLIKDLTDGLANGFAQEGPNMFGGKDSPINEGIANVFDALSKNIKPLMGALADLAGEVLSQLVDFLVDWATKNPGKVLAVFGVLFGPAIISGAISMLFATLSSLVTTMVIPGLASVFGTAFTAAGGLAGGGIAAGFSAMLGAVGSALAAIAAPIGIAIAAIMTVVEIVENLMDLFSFLTDDTKTMGEKVGYFIGSMVDTVTIPIQVLLDVFDFLTFGIFDLSGAFEGGLADMKNGMAAFFNKFTPFFEGMYQMLQNVFQFIKDYVMAAVVDPFMNMLSSLANLFQMLWSVVEPIMSAMGEIFMVVLQGTFMAAYNAVSGAITTLGEMFTGLYNDYIAPIIEPIAAFLDPLWTKFSEIVGSIGTAIGTVASYFNPMTWISMAADAITGFMSEFNLAEKVGNMAKGAVDSVKNFFGISSPSTVMAGFGGNVVDGFMGSISAMPEEMMAEMQGVVDAAASAFGALKDVIMDMVNTYIDLITYIPLKFIEGLDFILAKVTEFGPMVAQFLFDAVDNIVNVLTSGIDQLIDILMMPSFMILDAVSAITESLFGLDIATPFREGFDKVKGIIVDAIGFIAKYLNPATMVAMAVDMIAGFTGSFDIAKILKEKMEAAISGVKSFLGISSPSTLMAEMGEQTAAGFSQGTEEMEGSLKGPTQESVDKLSKDVAGLDTTGLDEAAAKLDGINSMTGAVGDLMEKLGEITVGEPGQKLKALGAALGVALPEVTNVGEVIENFVSTYGADKLKQLTGMVVAVVKEMNPMIAAITDMTNGITGMFDALFTLDQGIQNKGPNELRAALGTALKGVFGASKGDLNGILPSFMTFMQGFGGPEELGTLSTELQSYAKHVGSISDSVAGINDSLTKLFESIGKLPEIGTLAEKTLGNTAELVNKINTVGAALGELKPLAAETTVQKVAAGLAGDGTVTVQHEGLNINVSFKVNIDSKDLAAALGDDAEGGPFFVINTSRGGADAGGAEAAGE